MSTARRTDGLTSWGVPNPYPDELLTSCIARYLRNWAYLDAQSMLTAALGRGRRLIHAVCPPGLSRLTSTAFDGRAPKLVLLRHTLVPYALSATPSRVAAGVAKRLLGGDDQRLTGMLRLTALGSSFADTYQYCPDCAEQEFSRYGEPYWHRLHQLRGISHCPAHGRQLLQSIIPTAARGACDVVAASTAIRNGPAPRKVHAILSLEVERHIASLAATTMGVTSFGTPFSRTDTAKMLRRLGYGAPRRQIRATLLSADIQRFLKEHSHRSAKLHTGNWWLRLFTAVPGAVSPLQHHLFMAFVQRRFEDL